MPRAFRAVAIALMVIAWWGAPADARRSIVARFPRAPVPAGANVENCVFVRVPTTHTFDLGAWHITNHGTTSKFGVRHFLVYVYTGEHLKEFPAGTVMQSRGCVDFGPADRDHRVLIASGTSPSLEHALPVGVALPLAPVPDEPGGAPAGIGILLDQNLTNADTKPHSARSRIVLQQAREKRVTRHARLLSDRTAEAGILVAPFTERSTRDLVDARWSPTADACVLGLSTQMRKRGRCAGVDLLAVDGTPKPPVAGLTNPCDGGRLELFVGNDYTDPGSLGFTTPMAVRAGEALRYACWHDNGTRDTTVRLGCTSTPATPPGAVGAPAPSCTLAGPATAECGGAACVAANLVAGPGFEDDACGLTAIVYDAAPGGGCDVSGAR